VLDRDTGSDNESGARVRFAKDRGMTQRRPIIAVDAVGGENAPDEIVAGASRAARKEDVDILFVGPVDLLPTQVYLEPGISVLPSQGAIGMSDDPVKQLRRQRHASVAVACRAVRDGIADAVVSAGPTGATVAAARIELGRLPGVRRPAIASVLPDGLSRRGRILLDTGAHLSPKPASLLEFARLGVAFARVWLDGSREFPVAGSPDWSPVVGLLNAGAERHKGSHALREAYRLLEFSEMQFIGNVEGWELFDGPADVVVTDGFTGNVALKTAEGVSRFMARQLASLLPAQSSPFGDVDLPDAVGGSLLLGVGGVCVVGHGAASADAVCNAVGQAARAVRLGVVDNLRIELAPHASRWSRDVRKGRDVLSEQTKTDHVLNLPDAGLPERT